MIEHFGGQCSHILAKSSTEIAWNLVTLKLMFLFVFHETFWTFRMLPRKYFEVTSDLCQLGCEWVFRQVGYSMGLAELSWGGRRALRAVSPTAGQECLESMYYSCTMPRPPTSGLEWVCPFLTVGIWDSLNWGLAHWHRIHWIMLHVSVVKWFCPPRLFYAGLEHILIISTQGSRSINRPSKTSGIGI